MRSSLNCKARFDSLRRSADDGSSDAERTQASTGIVKKLITGAVALSAVAGGIGGAVSGYESLQARPLTEVHREETTIIIELCDRVLQYEAPQLGGEYSQWPNAEETRSLLETISGLGSTAHAQFATLTTHGEEGMTPMPGVEFGTAQRLGLVRIDGGRANLTELGRKAARLFTAEGPPPEGIDLEDYRIFATDRAMVQEDLKVQRGE